MDLDPIIDYIIYNRNLLHWLANSLVLVPIYAGGNDAFCGYDINDCSCER